MSDFIFHGKLAELDPDVYELTQLESERQNRKLILIPSESKSPMAVREALGSAFLNVYAEGYPDEDTRWMNEEDILDYSERLTYFRRYSDPRYYKGVEYADIVESLARRRAAELFATNGIAANDLYVNVQPLSGAPANNAVYTAFLNPGDTILGMNLLHGGHLTHGSSVNRSGKVFNAVHYGVSPVTEMIDYDEVEAIARIEKPKIIIAGYSSYTWVPDWARFRAIADSVGAIFMADISHLAGLVAAKVIPSPVGYAHVITFTTHKTFCGPRSGCIITNDPALGRKLDKAVFPGEQGGPHVNVFAAMALTFKLAKTEKFKELQSQILKNCVALTEQLKVRGFHIPFGGTDTHMTNLDCKSVLGPDHVALSGDQAARILDIAGIVTNRNTIPGDKSSNSATGIRMGTPWLTQRGFKEKDFSQVADIIADVLQATIPYEVESRKGLALRAKVDFEVLENARIRTRDMAQSFYQDEITDPHGYPHFYFLDDKPHQKEGWSCFELNGRNIRQFANFVFSSDIEDLLPGESQSTGIYCSECFVEGILTCIKPDTFQFCVPADKASMVAAWMRDLSDGYIAFDRDLLRRMPGPIVVNELSQTNLKKPFGKQIYNRKPYFIGITTQVEHEKPCPKFNWHELEKPLRKTSLNAAHRLFGAKMVAFAGWDMPVWYSSVVEEHLATRQAAGLFDVSHMGVYQAEGHDAASFLDCVCANDIAGLAPGESCYTHILDPDANVIDDTLVYRRSEETFLVVVNASNDDKDWAWLNSVREGNVLIDNERPWAQAFGKHVILRNLRDPGEGKDQRIDIALQGPKSREILLSMGCNPQTRKNILALKRTELCDAVIGDFDLVVSRTGYTGEKMAFELFVHPEQAGRLWNSLLEVGKPFSIKPCGLGARDSLRTEAGLPLYGHEMGGMLNLGVSEAGFGSYVKVYKPWFIGRQAYLAREKLRTGVVTRFRFTEKGVRMAHLGDPVIDKKGQVIGRVTSCAIDSEGFLTGQAFVDLKYAVEGTNLMIYQGAPKSIGKNPSDLILGDRLTLPVPAIVISRFPK
jgi:glycine hydroxymethyltransferase